MSQSVLHAESRFHTDDRLHEEKVRIEVNVLAQRMLQIAIAFCCAALASCGSGDEPVAQTPPTPTAEQFGATAGSQFASSALALPAPVAAETPMMESSPPAPTDEPLRRAPQSSGDRLNLGKGMSTGLMIPSILRRTIIGGLAAPTDLAVASDGTLFYTERGKGLFVIRAGAGASPVFAPDDLAKRGSSGMLAVALDPEFSRNQFAYVFMRSTITGIEDSRVVRVKIDTTYARALDRRDILIVVNGSAPTEPRTDEPHYGGALRFGPDGHLYVGVGDGRAAKVAQSRNSLAGKVLRIDRDGVAAPGNGVLVGFDKRVFVYGVRDPVALAFHPNTESALIGQRRSVEPDEIAMANAGSNGGWDPTCTPPASGYCERSGDQVLDVPASGMFLAWRGAKNGEGLSAIERLRSPEWGDWRNAFVVAFDQAQRLDLVKLDANGRTLHATPVLQKLGVGFKAVAQGADGLYVVTRGRPGGEEIWRLSPQ